MLAAVLIEQRMPIAARGRNSIVAAAAVLYFSGVHSAWNVCRPLRRFFSKELLVGLIFTAGCAAPTVSRMHFSLSRLASEWPVVAGFAFFAALAWVNCSAIEIWESGETRKGVLLRCGALSVAGVMLAVALAPWSLRGAALTGAGAASALVLMALDRRDVSSLTLRTLADAALLIPGLLVLGAAHA